MRAPSVLAMHAFDLASGQVAPWLPVRQESRRSVWGLPEWFAVVQVGGPALLYLPGSQALRAPLRVGVFAISLIGLVWCLRSSRLTRVHRSWFLLIIAAAYMAIMLSHPATNTTLAGLAQIGMHLAIAAPLIWAPDYFWGDYRRLMRVLTILWLLNGASVLVGILQVRNPGTWMPAEFSSVAMSQKLGTAMYQYRTADGSMAIRPPGLGDSPGAACTAGVFVALTGLAFQGLNVSRLRKLLGFLMGMLGIVVIFLTHVRSALVVVVGCAAVYSIIMVVQGRLRTVLSMAVLMAVCAVCTLGYAELYGGKSTIDRFATLLAENPLTVYEKSARLGMVAGAFDTLLVDYPFGAGLGRWGMMRTYFGNESNFDSPLIWAEVQFAAWVLDGGIVLLSLYVVALTVAVQRPVRLSLFHRSSQLRQWAAVIVMLSAGPIATLFSYCPFSSQTGMQFWLLIGAFEGLAQGEDRRSASRDQGGAGIVLSHEFADQPSSQNDGLPNQNQGCNLAENG
jgi:hypothetical protein